MVLFFCHTRKTSIWRPEKGDQVARIGGRGGYLIWAMPERKRAFTYEVFPNCELIQSACHEQHFVSSLNGGIANVTWETQSVF